MLSQRKITPTTKDGDLSPKFEMRRGHTINLKGLNIFLPHKAVCLFDFYNVCYYALTLDQSSVSTS